MVGVAAAGRTPLRDPSRVEACEVPRVTGFVERDDTKPAHRLVGTDEQVGDAGTAGSFRAVRVEARHIARAIPAGHGMDATTPAHVVGCGVVADADDLGGVVAVVDVADRVGVGRRRRRCDRRVTANAWRGAGRRSGRWRARIALGHRWLHWRAARRRAGHSERGNAQQQRERAPHDCSAVECDGRVLRTPYISSRGGHNNEFSGCSFARGD